MVEARGVEPLKCAVKALYFQCFAEFVSKTVSKSALAIETFHLVFRLETVTFR